MKSIYVKPDSYAKYNINYNERDPKFQVRDHVRISKCRNIFAEGYTPNWSEEVFVIAILRIHLQGFMALMI